MCCCTYISRSLLSKPLKSFFFKQTIANFIWFVFFLQVSINIIIINMNLNVSQIVRLKL